MSTPIAAFALLGLLMIASAAMADPIVFFEEPFSGPMLEPSMRRTEIPTRGPRAVQTVAAWIGMNSGSSRPCDLRSFIREREGMRRCDLSPLLANPVAFRQTVLSMLRPFRGGAVAKVAGLEGMGLAFAGAVAQELRSGLVLFRKPGLLAWDTLSVPFTDYTGEVKAFEITSDAIAPGDRVLIVDDWAETGGQLHAAIQMIERQHAEVVGAALVNIDSRVTRDPRFNSYLLHAVLEY